MKFFFVSVLAWTVVGVLYQQTFDGVLAVEEYAPDYQKASSLSGLEDPFLLAGIAYAESRGEPTALSSVGAMGLCQLMPATAEELMRRHQVEGDPMDPELNFLLAGHYIMEMKRQFEGDVDLALLAYRLGPGTVRRGILEAGGPESYKGVQQKRKPGPWEYRTQVLRFRDRFAERAYALAPSS